MEVQVGALCIVGFMTVCVLQEKRESILCHGLEQGIEQTKLVQSRLYPVPLVRFPKHAITHVQTLPAYQSRQRILTGTCTRCWYMLSAPMP